jgi:sensor domain CHASE-containing protein
MESSGATVSMNDKQNNESSGASLILNDPGTVRIKSRRSKSKREVLYILITFLVLFVVLFVIMTTLFAIEKRKQIQQAPKKLEAPTTSPSPEVCTSVECVLTITG